MGRKKLAKLSLLDIGVTVDSVDPPSLTELDGNLTGKLNPIFFLLNSFDFLLLEMWREYSY